MPLILRMACVAIVTGCILAGVGCPEPAPTPSPGLQLLLDEAEARGLAQVDVTGVGLTSIRIDLQSTSTDPLNVSISPGTIFEAQSAGTQNMVVTKQRDVYLSSYGSSKAVTVPAACANMELDVPDEGDTFGRIRRTPSEDLLKLLSLPDFSDETTRVQQFAVWTITDNPDTRFDYRGLRTSLQSWGSGPDEDEILRIQTLFKEAGISTYKYPALGGVGETEFHLTDWTVSDYFGAATLQLSFMTTGDAYLVLTNPDGVQTDSWNIFGWENEAKLVLANIGEVPDAGQYRLTVEDAGGRIVATETFGFEGAKAAISEVSPTWEYLTYFDEYNLNSLSFKVSNVGDLPLYICAAKVTVDGKETIGIVPYEEQAVLPGQEKTLNPWVLIPRVAPGEKTFIMELKDYAGKVIGSYSGTVRPSA